MKRRNKIKHKVVARNLQNVMLDLNKNKMFWSGIYDSLINN